MRGEGERGMEGGAEQDEEGECEWDGKEGINDYKKESIWDRKWERE